MGCSSPGSSIHRILQARILEWVAMHSFRWSSCERIEPMSLMSPALASGFFTPALPGVSIVFNSRTPSIHSHTLESLLGGPLPLNWNLITKYSKYSCCCSIAQSCPTLWPHGPQHTSPPCPSPSPGVCPIHAHCIGDAIEPSHPVMPSCPALDLFQHQKLFQWVICSYQMTKILELQLQHQSFQWIFRVNLP